jgi:peptidoglycan/xylan/chitin deacetylase (PgdA/CDA1 family)
MNSVALLYHDVVTANDFESSGFAGAEADIYKLNANEFERHLDAIAHANPRVLMTFDDGGISFYDRIAPALEQHGWRGYFFIATNWIGKPGFLNTSQIRDLRSRGHMVGTHSCSHPLRMSHCAFEEIQHEWTESVIRLSDILGERVEMGSVPGGYYSKKVAKAAALAGIRTLFTSEPTLNAHSVDGCVVVGRFTVRQGTSAEIAAALARADYIPRLKQSLSWNTKKALKKAGGTAWLTLRKRVLRSLQPRLSQAPRT